jgi:hypothetical protein
MSSPPSATQTGTIAAILPHTKRCTTQPPLLQAPQPGMMAAHTHTHIVIHTHIHCHTKTHTCHFPVRDVTSRKLSRSKQLRPGEEVKRAGVLMRHPDRGQRSDTAVVDTSTSPSPVSCKGSTAAVQSQQLQQSLRIWSRQQQRPDVK